MTKLNEKEEKEFRAWYDLVSARKGLHPNPDNENQYYDYRGFWKNEKKLRDSILTDDPDSHFIDKYKLPGHPTFSNESIYSNSKTPGGSWEKVNDKWIFNHSKFTDEYADRTEEYLSGTGETANRYKMATKNTEVDQLLELGPDYNAVLTRIQSSPSLAKYLAEQLALKERGKKAQVASDVLDLLTNIGLTAGALSQISTANKAAGKLVPPAIPAVAPQSPELTQALYEARRGLDPSAVLSPAKQGIQDAYTAGLQQAQQASGGQAGAYQSMSQLLNLERMRAALGLAPLAQQVQQQSQQNYNQLLGERVSENQSRALNQLYATQMAMDQYNQDAAAVGGLGAAGRGNLVNAVLRSRDSLQRMTPYFFKSKYRPFDADTNKQMDYIEEQNARNLSGYPMQPMLNPPTRNFFTETDIGPADNIIQTYPYGNY